MRKWHSITWKCCRFLLFSFDEDPRKMLMAKDHRQETNLCQNTSVSFEVGCSTKKKMEKNICGLAISVCHYSCIFYLHWEFYCVYRSTHRPRYVSEKAYICHFWEFWAISFVKASVPPVHIENWLHDILQYFNAWIVHSLCASAHAT